MSGHKFSEGQWAWSIDGERYWNTFDTRDEAIADARSDLPAEDLPCIIFVAQVAAIADVVFAAGRMFDSDDLAERAEEAIGDDFGTEDDVIQGDAGMWDELEKRLRATTEQWVKDCHVHADWYQVGNVQEVTIEPLGVTP